VLLKAESVSLDYFDGDRNTSALEDVSIEIPEKEFIGGMGPSGSGKSSLLFVFSGLKRPTTGDVWFREAAYANMTEAALADLRRAHFGFVFQQPWLLNWQTAFENTLMGAPEIDDASIARAESWFVQLGIGDLMQTLPSRLSGGEKQRVCVARAMMNEPAVIFADEPTASLDHKNGHLVVDMLAGYKQQGTVVIVTHDPEMLETADRVLIMRDGRAVEWVTPQEAIRSGSLRMPKQ